MMDINPSQKSFFSALKTGKYNLIVFSYKFFTDYLTPVSIYHQVKRHTKGESFLLESVEGEEKISRFSFIGCWPLATFKTKGKNVYIDICGKKERYVTTRDPLWELRRLMSRFCMWPKENLRFFGGFVGYLGYDVVSFYEPVGQGKADDISTFDSYFILPRFLIVFDHIMHQVEILFFLSVYQGRNLKVEYERAVDSLEKIFKIILRPAYLSPLDFYPQQAKKKMTALRRKMEHTSSFTKDGFVSAVRKAKRYIREGDIIQVVLSQRFKQEFRGDTFLVYRYLRLFNPSPYMYYLDFGDVKIAGSSPEMLLRCEKGELTTRPIAGTRRRGRNEDEDISFEKDLLSDEKERAEHLMLVDLGRNDVGRVAKKGTVRVPIFMKVERFSHVMHIVSEVRGHLAKGEDMFSALKACFPAGTVSGAPKVRAMQIINELEPQRRGIYAGCIGYFSFTKSLDTCIIIRTIIFKNNYAYVQAGAGIVADSQPLREYRETVNKAWAQMLALQLAQSYEED